MTAQILDVDEDIFLLPDLFSAAECDALRTRAEAIGYTIAPITTARGPVMASHIRNNQRVMLDDPALAEGLLARLRPHLPSRVAGGWRLVGLNERLRWYRYNPGEKFDWHLDGAFVRSPQERSFLTVMLYLNEDFDGGETAFDLGGRHLVVAPQTGAVLIFPHPLLHTGARVQRGQKVVLRTDAMYARPSTAYPATC